MRTLALETSTRRGTVALVEDGRTIATRRNDDPRTHAERVVPMIDEALAEAGWGRSSLDVIACGIGPGSFTGVRVALATGKGIAFALGRPIVGVGSLRAMVGGLDPRPGDLVVPLLDARKGEVFYAVYAPGGDEQVAPAHVARADVAGLLAPHLARGAVVVGEVAAELPIVEDRVRRGPTTDLPDATIVARLAEARARAGDFDDLDALEPSYVRPPDIGAKTGSPRTLEPR